jgi:hydroxyacylglutathione hydrolase
MTLGPFATNSYLVSVPGSADCWIIDPSFGPAALIERVRGRGLTPVAIVLTHAHVDHIAGVADVRRAFPGVPVLVHATEAEWLSEPMLNLSALTGMRVTAPGPDGFLEDGKTLTLAGTTWTIRHTPGHSPGGVVLIHDPSGCVIAGDTLFAGSIGRTDFPGGDAATLASSIRNVLYRLPDETRVYPGHGPPTTVGAERRSNPYVRG